MNDAEEEMARRVAEFQSRQQKQNEEADKIYPVKLDEIRRIHEAGMKKSRTIIRRVSPRLKKNMRKIGVNLTSRINKPRRARKSNTRRPGTS